MRRTRLSYARDILTSFSLSMMEKRSVRRCCRDRNRIHMQRRPDRFNTKRKISPASESNLKSFALLAKKVKYGGNPEHKKNPGDFYLSPPAIPRPVKALCDTVNIFSRKIALRYLRRALKSGMVSCSAKGAWPQNIWALTDNGEPLEAQLENAELGTYHGYPMPSSDPFASAVINEWRKRNGAT